MLRSTCRIEIHIRRNWGVYFIKQICTMLLCTAGGLSALMMQPGELLGDRCPHPATPTPSSAATLQHRDTATPRHRNAATPRRCDAATLQGCSHVRPPPCNNIACARCALIVVAVLITLTAIQMDIGLGNLSYLIWVDWFNLLQLIVLLFALLQTMVHPTPTLHDALPIYRNIRLNQPNVTVDRKSVV